MCNKAEIEVSKSEYIKCERCWYYKPDCAYNTYLEDNLCHRCVQVLIELANNGQWMECPACLKWFGDRNCTSEDIKDNYLCKDCMKEMKK